MIDSQYVSLLAYLIAGAALLQIITRIPRGDLKQLSLYKAQTWKAHPLSCTFESIIWLAIVGDWVADLYQRPIFTRQSASPHPTLILCALALLLQRYVVAPRRSAT